MAEFIPKELCKEFIGRLCRKYDAPIGLAKELSNTVDKQPVSDVKPVVHAGWEEHHLNTRFEYFTCSMCGERNSEKSCYCPHCGAMMDGKD